MATCEPFYRLSRWILGCCLGDCPCCTTRCHHRHRSHTVRQTPQTPHLRQVARFELATLATSAMFACRCDDMCGPATRTDSSLPTGASALSDLALWTRCHCASCLGKSLWDLSEMLSPLVILASHLMCHNDLYPPMSCLRISLASLMFPF